MREGTVSYVLIQVREKMKVSSGTCEDRVDGHGISKCDEVSEWMKSFSVQKGGWMGLRNF